MAILLVDYYFIAKGFLDIDMLFRNDKGSKYYYTYGVNLRAVAAYLAGVGVNFGGKRKRLAALFTQRSALTLVPRR